ncbi:hypothetical protein ACFPM7_01700 [Actinokineospora guangxiensis]|uniref:Uncharacterized protein n=1 Tax=Actinokineospora guangxiensis TaxID=1490288 RepID=A0ABW0EHL3_9PSEU
MVEAGPTRLWAAVEAGFAERQWVWCDDPAGGQAWPLDARLR